MSKFTKLRKTPLLFFKDMILKRLNKLPKKNIKKRSSTLDRYQLDYFIKYKLILYTGEGLAGESYIDLWLPYFKKSEEHFLILVRNLALFNKIKNKYPTESIVYAKRDIDIEEVFTLLPYLKASFYPSNSGNNLHLLQFGELKHIFIGHGDSDKTASAHKYFRVYDENWVAGEAHIDRFRNEGFDFSGLKFVKVGRPNLKETLVLSETNWRDRFDGELNILYLSTWEGVYQEQNYTSVYIIEEFFQKITKSIKLNNIRVKLHPRVGSRDGNLKSFNQKLEEIFQELDVDAKVFDKTTPVETLIKKSNIFICDISAVVSESLSANAPIFVYLPKDKDIKLSQSKMSYENYTYTFSTIEELLEKMEEVIVNNNDYLADKREEAMEYILGKKETLEDKFIKELKKI